MAKTKLNAPESSETSSQKDDKIEKSAFFTVLSYCLLIIFLPILCFFLFKYLLFDGALNLTSVQSNIYAAIIAVVALHLALFLYIYRAYFNSDPAVKQKAKKKD